MFPLRIPFASSATTVFHAQTKHIEVHYDFIREHVKAGEIDLQHISMNLQVADIFTKALGVDKLGQFALGLGLTSPALSSLRGSTTVSVTRTICNDTNRA